MKIISSKENRTVEWEEIKIGDCFQTIIGSGEFSDLLMKTRECKNEGYNSYPFNAVDLKTGDLISCLPSSKFRLRHDAYVCTD